MTNIEATVLANFLDKVLPGTETREVMVTCPPQLRYVNEFYIVVAEDSDVSQGTAKAMYQLNTFEEVHDYMKVKTAMRISAS